MNQEPPANSLWARLVAINPSNQNIVLSTDKHEDLLDGKLTISQNEDGDAFLKNLSASCIHIDDSLLETNQEKQLFGGERICLKQDNDTTDPKLDYVFCFVHSLSGLQSEKDESFESENFKKLLKIESDLEKELTCSICTHYLEKCMTLTPCQHANMPFAAFVFFIP